MIKASVTFLSFFTFILLPSYFLHNYIITENYIVAEKTLLFEAYLVNYILAAIIFFTLLLLQKKYEHLLGFIFMGGSLLKFAVFFIFFYPTYRIDGGISKLEATSFLIPYMLSLVIETYFLVRLLNKKTK